MENVIIAGIIIGNLINIILLLNAKESIQHVRGISDDIREIRKGIKENSIATELITDKIQKLAPDKYVKAGDLENFKGHLYKALTSKSQVYTGKSYVKTDPPENYRPCTACNGTGKVIGLSGERSCFSCNGRGIIFEV